MKMKKVFLAALGALALFSCSKNDNNTPDEQGQTRLLGLKLSSAAFTKSVEAPGSTALEVKGVVIELYNAEKAKIDSKSLTLDQISGAVNQSTAIDAQSRIVWADVSSEAVYAKIYASQGTLATAPTLGSGVNDYQTGFSNVPFVVTTGSIDSPLVDGDLVTINKTATTNTADKKIWTVEATLAPSMGRFEVRGLPTASTLTANDGDGSGVGQPWATFTLTGVYINNIFDKAADAGLTLNTGNHENWGAGDWSTPNIYLSSWNKMFDGGSGHTSTNALLNGGNVAAYNIFAQPGTDGASSTNTAPHVIARLWVQPHAALGRAPYYAFITLRKFKIDDATANYLNHVKNGVIYRVDLSSLTNVRPEDVKPDPEDASADLYAKITILPWSTVDLKPEI